MVTLKDGKYIIEPSQLNQHETNELNLAKTENCIVYCVDDNIDCNIQLCASLYTARKNTVNNIYILTTENNSFISIFRNIGAKVLLLDQFINKYLSQLNLTNSNKIHPQNISTYFRFSIFENSLFQQYKKILYLDCDTQIYDNLDATIFKLDGSRLFACKELLINRNPVSDLIDFCNEKNIEVKIDKYFNAGVLLLVNELIDREKVFQKFLALAKFNFTWHDQDILNIIFNDFTCLDPRFNSFKFTDILFQNRRDIVIRHYVGERYKLDSFGQKIKKNFQKNIFDIEYIPKILHFIWVGENVPNYVNMSIDAYRKINPDFKINFINEKNIDNLRNEDSIECMKQIQTPGTIYNRLYNNPKNLINTSQYSRFSGIRFSDTLRFYLLQKYGGIYLDNDTYPVKPFDDNLLQNDIKICRSYIVKTQISNDKFTFDKFFIACVLGKIFEYYKGYDEKKVPNCFEINKYDTLFEYTDRNFEDYESIGGNTVYLKNMHSKYYSGKMNLGIDRVHIKHDWKNEEQNYYIDHYNRKSWLQ